MHFHRKQSDDRANGTLCAGPSDRPKNPCNQRMSQTSTGCRPSFPAPKCQFSEAGSDTDGSFLHGGQPLQPRAGTPSYLAMDGASGSTACGSRASAASRCRRRTRSTPRGRMRRPASRRMADVIHGEACAAAFR